MKSLSISEEGFQMANYIKKCSFYEMSHIKSKMLSQCNSKQVENNWIIQTLQYNP